jgi:hypothetical protein
VKNMKFPDEIYEQLAEVLASCYRSIDWSKAGQKSAYDYFATRVRSAGDARSVPVALNLLARRCNVTYFDIDPDALVFLCQNEREVLHRLRSAPIPIAMMATKLAKERKAQKGNTSLESFGGK